MAKRETFGQIPEPKRVRMLKNIYADMESYLEKNIYSFNLNNYNRKQAKRELKDLSIRIKNWNVMIGIYWDNTTEPTYRKAKIRTQKAIESKFNKEKQTVINHQGTIDRQNKRIMKNALKVNKSIIPQAVLYLDALDFATNTLNDLKLQEMTIGQLRTKVKDIIKAGLISKLRTNQKGTIYQGTLTRTQIERNIKDLYKSEFGDDVNFLIVNGKKYKFKPYAEMLARTEMRKAQTNAVINSCKEYKNDLVQFSIHAHLIPNYEDFDPCAPLELEVFSISGNNAKYQQLDASNTPPIHPRCMHNLNPYDELKGVA